MSRNLLKRRGKTRLSSISDCTCKKAKKTLKYHKYHFPRSSVLCHLLGKSKCLDFSGVYTGFSVLFFSFFLPSRLKSIIQEVARDYRDHFHRYAHISTISSFNFNINPSKTVIFSPEKCYSIFFFFLNYMLISLRH